MFDSLLGAVSEKFENAVDKGARVVQRRLLRIALKAFFLIAALAVLSAGFIMLGAKYIGAEFMLILAGVIFLLGFLVA
jgi:hypothetical protein